MAENDFLVPNLKPFQMPELSESEWSKLTTTQKSDTDRQRYLREYATYPRFPIPIPGAGDLVVMPDGDLAGFANIPPEMLGRPDVQAVIQAARSRAQLPQVTAPLKELENRPTLTENALPQIMELLGQRSQFLIPQIEALRELTGQNVAQAQSDIGARGLRGSDIEQAALIGARGQGQAAEAQLRGQFALESSKLLSDLIFKAMLGDNEAAVQLKTLLAQAMGQQLGGERDILVAGSQTQANLTEAEKMRKQSQTNAIIQGSISAIPGLIKLSDRRLKTNIKTIKTVNGIRIVSFQWNGRANSLGLYDNKAVGVIAQEIEKKYPKLVGEESGYKTVNYSKLPKEVRQAIAANGGFNG